MKTKSLVVSCILLAVGFVLHAVVPGIGSMKPDFMLAMMILAIFMNPNVSTVIITAFIAASLSALTSVFPGGQILSFLDKIVSALIVLGLLQTTKGLKNRVQVLLISGIGTFASGLTFLLGACYFLKMGTSVFGLLLIIVLPTVFLNIVLNDFIYNRVILRLKLLELK